jgi:hypothetical protein
MMGGGTRHDTGTERRRPQAIVDVETDLTRLAIGVCDRLVKVALDERRGLLADGWPPGHSLCEGLDQVALRWSGEGDHQRRALRKLLAEAGIQEEVPDRG